MEGSVTNLSLILALTFLVAVIYSSVGHGGASGYLALLSFFSIPHDQMATSALILNLLVTGVAFWFFWKAAHFSWSLTWPFVVTSMPAAFAGGLMKIPSQVYSLLLAFALLFAAFRLWIDLKQKEGTVLVKTPSPAVSFPVGAGVGMLSGLVGVGGGIFLSPLILLRRWANAKVTAATSAVFIFVNSFAGLTGRFFRESFELALTPVLLGMVACAFLGGVLGSRLGANHFSGLWLRRILALLLIIACFKLFWMR